MAVAAATHAMVPGGGDADNDKLVLPDGYTTPAGFSVALDSNGDLYSALLARPTPPTDGPPREMITDFVLLRHEDGSLWYDCVICPRRGNCNPKPKPVISLVNGKEILFSKHLGLTSAYTRLDPPRQPCRCHLRRCHQLNHQSLHRPLIACPLLTPALRAPRTAPGQRGTSGPTLPVCSHPKPHFAGVQPWRCQRGRQPRHRPGVRRPPLTETQSQSLGHPFSSVPTTTLWSSLVLPSSSSTNKRSHTLPSAP